MGAGGAERVLAALRDGTRDGVGRDAMASAGAVHSPSVGGSATVGADSRGHDAGKRTNGRERHVAVIALATTAMPSLALIWPGGGYFRRIREAGDVLAPHGRRPWT